MRFMLLVLALFLCACPRGDFLSVDSPSIRRNERQLIQKIKALNPSDTEKKANEAGNGLAQNDMGLMYLYGVHFEKNEKEALYWFRKSAESAEAIGFYNLGISYLKGIGDQKRDLVLAHQWLNLAHGRAGQGNQTALVNATENVLSAIEDSWILLGRRKISKAKSLARQYMIDRFGSPYAWVDPQLLKFAKKGEVNSLARMGEIFHFGQGVAIDDAIAYGWYDRCKGSLEICDQRQRFLETRMNATQMEEAKTIAKVW